VVCGSAASWMIDKLIHAKGGLHNRITRQIRLAPFSLPETIAFLKARQVKLGLEPAAELYMAIPGPVTPFLEEIRIALGLTIDLLERVVCYRGALLPHRLAHDLVGVGLREAIDFMRTEESFRVAPGFADLGVKLRQTCSKENQGQALLGHCVQAADQRGQIPLREILQLIDEQCDRLTGISRTLPDSDEQVFEVGFQVTGICPAFFQDRVPADELRGWRAVAPRRLTVLLMPPGQSYKQTPAGV
jgi:hypothetical protein